MKGIKISGLGKSLPKLKVTNEAISKLVETSDEWIYSRTGISNRSIAQSETTTSLAIAAARQALLDSGNVAVDLIIVATSTPDQMMPSTACQVGKALNIEGATCFDLTAACTGFIYASEVAMNMIKAGRYQHALVIGAEVMSQAVDWQDRNTCVLFGDGAGAVIYSVALEKGLLVCQTQSLGSDLISLPCVKGDSPFKTEEGTEAPYMRMDGRRVYGFATKEVPKNIQDVLQRAQCLPEEVTWYVLHQANSRIIDQVAKQLKISNDKFFKNMKQTGNTSAASIPIALCELKSQLKIGDRILLAGFGAGLTWGSLLIQWH